MGGAGGGKGSCGQASSCSGTRKLEGAWPRCDLWTSGEQLTPGALRGAAEAGGLRGTPQQPPGTWLWKVAAEPGAGGQRKPAGNYLWTASTPEPKPLREWGPGGGLPREAYLCK